MLDDFDRVVSKFPATLQNIANMSKKREAEAKEVERRRKLSNNSTSEEKESGGRLSRLGIRRGSASALATAFRRKSNPTLLDMTQLGILKNHMKDRENLQSKNSQSKEDSGGRREKACTVPNPPIPRESNVQNFDSTPQEGGQGRDSIAGNLKTKAGKETISGNLAPIAKVQKPQQLTPVTQSSEGPVKNSAGRDRMDTTGTRTTRSSTDSQESMDVSERMRGWRKYHRKSISVVGVVSSPMVHPAKRKQEKQNRNNDLLSQPRRLRHEKIKTVPDLALSVTRWQSGMNARWVRTRMLQPSC